MRHFISHSTGVCAGLVATLLSAAQALEFSPIYGNDMVLQQGKPVPVCGTTDSREPIRVSFKGQEVTAESDGRTWRAVLPAMTASCEGATLSVTQGSDSVSLSNVVVGEVWIASGQSNMLWRLNQTPGNRATISAATHPNFRFFHSEPQVHTNAAAYTPQLNELLETGQMYRGSWASCTPQSVPRLSAVAYYFGTHLQEQLGDVPVGIVHCSLGGSEMLAWLPEKDLMKKYPECKGAGWLESEYISAWVRGRARQNLGKNPAGPHPYKPAYLFESGLARWQDFPIAGVIWYQGESDAEIQDMRQNLRLLTDLVRAWQGAFRQPELPFIMVQLPRINDPAPLRKYWPEFRTVQTVAARDIPGVCCVNTLDLGSTNRDVHPPRKVEVGQRLAAAAAAQVYGKDVPWCGPTATTVSREKGRLRVRFEHAEGLTTTDGAAPVGFEVAGSNGDWQPATATIEGDSVILSSPKVKAPTRARYAWATMIHPNLVNAHKLPAVPFNPITLKKR